jgi:hypothetical protein
MKPKVSLIPKRESPEQKHTRFQIKRMEWELRNGCYTPHECERIKSRISYEKARLANNKGQP